MALPPITDEERARNIAAEAATRANKVASYVLIKRFLILKVGPELARRIVDESDMLEAALD